MQHSKDGGGELQSLMDTDYHRDVQEKSLKVDQHTAIDKECLEPQHHPQKTKRFLCWRLTKRKWIAASIGCVVVALGVILLILWFVVADAIFQSNADKVKLTLNHMDIVNVEKGETVRTLGASLSLHFQHDLSIGAKSDPTKVQLLFGGETFASVDFPALDLKTGKQEYDLLITNDIEVSDAGVFAKLAQAMITQQMLTIEAHAVLTARALGLSKGGIKFDRTLDLAGMNNYTDPKSVIELMTMKVCSLSSLNIAINASVSNVAQVGLEGIGALNLSLYYEQDYLGYGVSALPELGVPRGPSDQLFNIFIDISASQLPVVKKMVSGIAFGSAQFFMTGDNPYATEIGLLQEPLKSLNMSFAYADRLNKIAFDPSCDLLTLVGLI